LRRSIAVIVPQRFGTNRFPGLTRPLDRYNGLVSFNAFDELKAHVDFSVHDERRIAELGAHADRLIPVVVERFYDALLKQARARAVFVGGAAQIARQKVLLADWMSELFSGPYDEAYYLKRYRIGSTHVRVGLPQCFMVVSMEVIWDSFRSQFRRLRIVGVEEKLASLHRLLMLDLTIMLESYHGSSSEQVRLHERAAMEEKLTRSEHLAEIGQLAASLAHEIKNPLAGISGAIQIIGDGLRSDDPHKPIIGEILGQITRLDSTVKDLLLYARPTPPKSRETTLDALIPRVLTLLREEPVLQRVQVEFRPDATPTTVYADEGQIVQLLINLILNAAQASPEGGLIVVYSAVNGRHATIVVRDSGPGMPPEVLRRAVEPFFTTKTQGTGLGLSICRRIVESHGGRMRLESTPGAGTTVTVELPRPIEPAAVEE
jgi:signal transduction histidine kinase